MSKPIIVILCVVVLAVLVTLLQGDKYKKFLATATKTSGRIVQKEERLADPSKSHTRKERWLHYSFRDQAGNEYFKQDLIEFEDLWMSLRESYPIDIYYNPQNPSQSYIAPVIERRVGIAEKWPK